MFIESNPVPVKGLMAMMGTIREDVRLPLVTLSNDSKEVLKKLAKQVEIL